MSKFLISKEVLVLILFGFFFGQAYATDAAAPEPKDYPKVLARPGEVGKIELGPSIENAIEVAVPGFKLYKPTDFIPEVVELFIDADNQAISAVSGHFSSKKYNEIILMGHTEKLQLVLAVSNKPSGVTVEKVLSENYVPPEKSFYPPSAEAHSPKPKVDVARAVSSDKESSDSKRTDSQKQVGLYRYLSMGEKNKGLDTFQVEALYGVTVRYSFKDGHFVEMK